MGWVFFLKDAMLVDALMSRMVPSIIDTWLRTKYSPSVASVSNRQCCYILHFLSDGSVMMCCNSRE